MVQLQGLMRQHAVRQIPIVDESGFLVDLVVDADFSKEKTPELRAVIMAGGKGSRLHPLTENTPKPMLPVGGRPLMEWIVEQLRDSGIHRIHVSTHFQSEKISEHFGDGNAFGVDIQYVSEEQPLGTAGSLSLLEHSQEPLLVMNGDILTQVNFRAMYDYHREHQAEMTVGVRHYEFQVPYGVVECEESRITALREKPVQQFFVNAGIYLLEPSVFRFIPEHQRQDMTEVIDRLLKVGANVVSFPIMEAWIDIGQHADYEKAQSEIERRSS